MADFIDHNIVTLYKSLILNAQFLRLLLDLFKKKYNPKLNNSIIKKGCLISELYGNSKIVILVCTVYVQHYNSCDMISIYHEWEFLNPNRVR